MTAATKKKIKKTKAASVKTEVSAPKSPKVISSQIKKRIDKKSKKFTTDRGVVLIRNLPHGFYEEQLKAYFGQFGKVTRVRVVRSRKTTKSRGFAYVEFSYPEVAEIAAETMNNYLMFKRMIKTVYLPPKDQKYNYFKSGVLMVENQDGKEVLTTRYRLKLEHNMNKYNRTLNTNELEKRRKADAKKIQKLKQKMAKFDIDYDIDSVVPNTLKGEPENVEMKSESDVEEPEKLPFDAGSDEDSEAHELDSDASVEVDPVKAKKKKAASILQAKKASKKLIEAPVVVQEKKKKKKLAGVEKVKKEKPTKKINLAMAAKEIVKGKKIVENPIAKAKKRVGKKLK